MPRLDIKRLDGTRIIAKPAALNALESKGLMLRFAPDDALVLSKVEAQKFLTLTPSLPRKKDL